MNKQQVLQQIRDFNSMRLQRHKDAIRLKEVNKAADWQIKDYTLFSTNIEQCLPEIPVSDHWSMYLRALTYRSLLLSEHGNGKHLDMALSLIEGTGPDACTGPFPALFTSFHFGSYRSVVGVLLQQRIDFAMVVNDEIYQTEADRIRATVEQIKQDAGIDVHFDLINAEKPNAAIVMHKYLRQNISLLVFADGNRGQGGEFRRDDSMLKLDFLGKKIYARRGVGVIAKMLRCPVIPMYMYYPDRSSLIPAVKFHAPIIPTKADSITDLMQRLYNLLAAQVREYPTQWQNWFMFHKMIDLEDVRERAEKVPGVQGLEADASQHFNSERYGLFRMDKECFVFDRKTYLTYPVDRVLFDVLSAAKRGPVDWTGVNEQLNAATIQDLQEHHLLVASSTI